MYFGLRVVRGPDWCWEDQDGGEGGLGTVKKHRGTSDPGSADNTIFILWDNGIDNNYRTGHQGAYDLRIFDNAPAGVKHVNILCNGCRKKDIAGMRYSCQTCDDYDLCQTCYMADRHNTAHPFKRFTTPQSKGIGLTPRKNCRKVFSRGILVGATVKRGKHWDWGDQDGGKGGLGRVVDVRKWDNETERSVVSVEWAAGTQNVYRVGHKGKVDLEAVTPATGPAYYPAHLPALGIEENEEVDGVRPLSIGDRVRVIVTSDVLKEMQKSHSGYHPKMDAVLGCVGVVGRVTYKGDVRVEYPSGAKWTFNPACLERIAPIDLGDIVTVLSNLNVVMALQKGHGEWSEPMVAILGRVGRVVNVYSDYDLRVCIDGSTWTLNPLCVTLHPDSATINANLQGNNLEEDSDEVERLLRELKVDKAGISMEKLLKEAAQGHSDAVLAFLEAHPEMVNERTSGKTLLQVASHQGQGALVDSLVVRGADVSLADDEGDTPLHYAAFGNQSEVMNRLLDLKADINATNKNECTALHIAVSKQYADCVRILISRGANLNLQDIYGDTALHDAITSGSAGIVELLCSAPGISFTVLNKRGFNPLHHASLKGNTLAVEKIVCVSRSLVDTKKEDGFAPLHLAALNGHSATAEALLSLGSANVNIQNHRQLTPLMLAVSQIHANVVELLMSYGSDLSLKDEEGDTALHMAITKCSLTHNTSISDANAPYIHGIWERVKRETKADGAGSVGLAIACFLIQEGASLEVTNSTGVTPLDLLEEPLRPILLSFVPSLNTTKDESKGGGVPECIVCSETCPGGAVTLEPCGHAVACENCAALLKKCLKCSTVIDQRIASDGRIIAYRSSLLYLERKIAEMEELHSCSICMERRRNIAFLCGHGACDRCARTLTLCHMCRKPITKKIHLY